MGPGVPYAIAAKFAHPGRPAVALVGDGAMQMNGMAELITAAKYYERWADPRLVVLVLNNQDLNQVTWEQRAMEGDPKNPMTQRIPDVRYADFAKLIGLDGVRVETPDVIDAAWDEAFSADRPFVIDAVVDPDVPPLPPHITIEQAQAPDARAAQGRPERARDHEASRSSRRSSSSCPAGEHDRRALGRRASRSRPTRPSRTGRSSGTRRRS